MSANSQNPDCDKFKFKRNSAATLLIACGAIAIAGKAILVFLSTVFTKKIAFND